MGTHILQVSDTHLGKKQYGSNTRKEDYTIAFDTTIDIAIDEDVDAVIHTGDLFDDRSPNTREVSRAFQSVKRLDDHNIQFLGIVGNHERKWDEQWLDIFTTLDNVHRLSTEPYNINDEISVYGFDSIRDAEWETKDFDIAQPQNDDSIVCVCMHELFTELVPPSKADREIKTVIDRINIKPDIMPLGDYHAAVETDVDGVSAFYAGATERTSATQQDPTVRVIRVNDDNEVSSKWRKVEGVRDGVPRPFYKIEIELDTSSTRKLIREKIKENIPESKIDESVVVINLKGSSESPITPSGVYEVLDSMSVKVPYVSDKRQSENLEFEDINATDPTTIDIDDMIEDEMSDVSQNIREIDERIIRDLTVNKSDIRELVDNQFKIGDQE